IGNMETLLPDVIAAEPIERKLVKAFKAGRVKGLTYSEQVESGREAGVLSDKEADMLLEVRERVMEIIAVDDFELEELQAGITDKGEAVRDAA
ncbi:MAG TPA: acyl-CoA dehydrogenase domain-containing protein, partial [Wenzhouxiangellaceae bacterium]|nr:acyl-CoA dehydrogenase domain-containing protein [Wenzhouxiangellaceae bacterium]